MDASDRVIRAHPALISLGGLLAVFALPLGALTSSPLFASLMPGLYLAFQLSWSFALERISARKLGLPPRRSVLLLFVASLSAGAIALATPLGGDSVPPLLAASVPIVGAPAAFALMFLAAQRLAMATRSPADQAALGIRAFGLFLAVVYLPIGIWFLRGRLQTLGSA